MLTEQMMAAVDRPIEAPRAAHDFEVLFQQEAPDIWRALYAFSGGRRDVADEALAEAFARAIASRERIRDPVRWIYRVSFRIAAGELRRRRGWLDAPSDEVVDPPEATGVMEALRALSPMQRAAIVLRYEADLPVSEVARRLGIKQPTVRVHLHRGRTRLRELLGDEEVD
jgi:RNA polymerase sigma factor (sigma-70 family)